MLLQANIIYIASIAICLLILLVILWKQFSIHKDSLILNIKIEELQKNVIVNQKNIDDRLRDFISTQQQFSESLRDRFSSLQENLLKSFHELQTSSQNYAHQLQQSVTQNLSENKAQIHESIQKQMIDVRQQIMTTLTKQSDDLGKNLDKLTKTTEDKLKEISGQVEKRLTEGFEKTTATFSDVLKRLALIDEAQKRITELSTNVISLQEILSDKKSRGAFGEVQLSSLIRNLMPEGSFSFQHTLSTGKRADCVLFLPSPTGNVCIDAKFPLETYQRMMSSKMTENERKVAETQFRIDIKKHIQDIAEKYIISGETSDGAVMFIPAEAIFAEIHAHYPDLVEAAFTARVWLTSPTTMMAILTTARAVLKDEDTRKQVHVIQEHLRYLSKDFERFQKRMDNLARHIGQANEDVSDVNRSAVKISSRFRQIEKVELEKLDKPIEEIELLETTEEKMDL